MTETELYFAWSEYCDFLVGEGYEPKTYEQFCAVFDEVRNG